MKRRLLIAASVLLLAGLSGFYGMQHVRNGDVPTGKASSAARGATANQKPSVKKEIFNKSQHSLDDPASPWAVINKRRPLRPVEYVPATLTVPAVPLRSNITGDERQLTATAAAALESLVNGAKAEGIQLTMQSGYRSYNFQMNLYNRYVRQQGQDVADTQSARPGHSEHQTGLAADVGGISNPACNVEPCFADTAEGKWVADNAHTYGFIIRYPLNKAAVTGYIYEPWHLRYVGVELAGEIRRQSGVTMEELFSLPPAPDYN
ncbi:MAG TPA: M15 family metallopeptidase [Candidatus Saccharimonadales bacterium]|nr:M15 family metallopeptidase [Candidatus Saccharimonadales bacterium]